MKILTHHQRVTFPGIFVGLVCDLVARWSVTPEDLLAGSGVDVNMLHNPNWSVDFVLFNKLLERAVMLTREPGIGLFLGLQMTISLHGIVGYTAMSGRTLREAIDIFYHFGGLICPAIVPRLEVMGDLAYLNFDQPLPQYQMNDIAISFLLTGCGAIGSAMTGQFLDGYGEVPFEQPADFKRVAHYLPTGVKFGCAQTRLIFSAKYLDLPLVMADPLAMRLMREQCKRSLNEVMGINKRLSLLVRELSYDEVQGFFSIKDVAQKLNVTERTLQRQLAEEGQTFRDIIEEVRQSKSAILLQNPQLSLQYISDLMGYANPANFIRAFVRWYKKTPNKYRADILSSHSAVM